MRDYERRTISSRLALQPLIGTLFFLPIFAISDTGTDNPGEVSGSVTLRVGPRHKLKSPSAAAKMARDGDTVEIEAGVYYNNYAIWPQNTITIRGVGGMAHMKSEGLIPNGKAIWILGGDNIVIENIEFSGARVTDTNGAGIRHEGGDLTVSNAFFHNNEFSILSGNLPESTITVSSSRFWFQKRKNRYSHGIYIGKARHFTLVGSHIKGTDQGHQVKTRAFENHILYNRIEDVPQGNSSRLIDLSNCGLSIIMGNDLHQAATTGNSNAIGYGAEGCQERPKRQKALYVINNTFVDESRAGSMVRNFSSGTVLVSNNLVFGIADILVGDGIEANNYREPLLRRMPDEWAPRADSGAIDNAKPLIPSRGINLTPSLQFNPPLGTLKRPQSGTLDAGSREMSH